MYGGSWNLDGVQDQPDPFDQYIKKSDKVIVQKVETPRTQPVEQPMNVREMVEEEEIQTPQVDK